MPKKTTISPEEATLFRDAVGPVAALPARDRGSPRRQAPVPRPLMREKDEREVIEHLLDHPIDPAMLETGDELEYRQDGVQLTVMRKLRRGQYACQAELDLHGLTVQQARPLVASFLDHSRRKNLRCVRIIHGKGLRSRGQGPVLKGKVAGWLQHRNEVLAFCSARPVDGGTGALYVLMRR
jgi:DNA-nicking Smr family endonuclease